MIQWSSLMDTSNIFLLKGNQCYRYAVLFVFLQSLCLMFLEGFWRWPSRFNASSWSCVAFVKCETMCLFRSFICCNVWHCFFFSGKTKFSTGADCIEVFVFVFWQLCFVCTLHQSFWFASFRRHRFLDEDCLVSDFFH